MVKTEVNNLHIAETVENRFGLSSLERAFWAIKKGMHSPPLNITGEKVVRMADWYMQGEKPNLSIIDRRDLTYAWLVSNRTIDLRIVNGDLVSSNVDKRYIEENNADVVGWNSFVNKFLIENPTYSVVSVCEIDEGDAELLGKRYALTFEFVKGGELGYGKTQRHSWRIASNIESEEEGKSFLELLGEVMEGPNKRNYVRVLQKEALFDLHKRLHEFRPYEDWEYEILEKSFKFQREHENTKAFSSPISYYPMDHDERGRIYATDHKTGKKALTRDVFTNEAGRRGWEKREWEIKTFGYSIRRVAGGAISSVTAGQQEVEEIIDIIQRNPDGSITQFALKMAKGVPIALREEIYEYLEQNPFLDPKDLSLFIVSKIDEMPENVREELSVFKEGVLKGIASYEAFRGRVSVERGQREVVRNILPEFRRENDLFLGREIFERRVTVPIDEILRWRRLEGLEEASSSMKEVERRVEKKADIKGETPILEREEIEMVSEANVSMTAISYWGYLNEVGPAVPEGPGGGGVETTDYGLRSHGSVNTVEKLGNTKVAEQTRGVESFGREEEQALDRVAYVRHFVSGEGVYKVDKIMLEQDFDNEGKSEGIEKIGDTESGEVVNGADRDLDNTLGVDSNVESAVVLDKIPYVRDFVSEIEADKIDKTMLEHGFVNERESEGEFSDVTPRGSSFDSFGYAQDRFAQDHPRGVPFSEVSLPHCDLRGLNIGERKKWENIVLINNLPIGKFVDLRMLFIDPFNLRMILGGISTAPVLAMDEGELWMVEKGKRLIRDLTKNGGVYLSTVLIILVPAILYWIGNIEQVLA